MAHFTVPRLGTSSEAETGEHSLHRSPPPADPRVPESVQDTQETAYNVTPNRSILVPRLGSVIAHIPGDHPSLPEQAHPSVADVGCHRLQIPYQAEVRANLHV